MKYTNTKPFVIVFNDTLVPPLSEVELTDIDTQHHAIKAMIEDGTLKQVESEQVESEQVESEQVESEQVESEQVESEQVESEAKEAKPRKTKEAE